MAVSHRVFFPDGPRGTFHPCLLPTKPGSGASLAFLFRKPSCLLSDSIPSCDLGDVSGYSGLLSLGRNSSRV